MTINSTDKLIVQRGGASYSVAASDLNSKLLDTDLLLVNRGGVSYKVTGAAARTATLLDTDLLLVNQSGVSYQATGAEFKTLLPLVGIKYSDTMSGGWGFPTRLFDGDLTDGAQHRLGQPEAVWDASPYNLSGTLEIYGTNALTIDSVVKINGVAKRFAPGVTPKWVSMGTYSPLTSIGVTRGPNATPQMCAIRVAGKILVDS